MENNSLYNQAYYTKHECVFKAEERDDMKRILELLQPKKTDRVLDIGCGFGVLLAKFPSQKKIGIETNEVAMRECQKRGVKVIKADVDKGLPFPNDSFDIIIMNELISHVRKQRFVLEECFRVLSLKGTIILTAPARNFFFHNISETHLSEVTIKELRALVQSCNFKILNHEVTGISFIYPLLENCLFKPFRLLRFNLKKQQATTEVSLTDTLSVATSIKLIDFCHNIADKFIFKPISFYRKWFLRLGCHQLIFAQKEQDDFKN